ncbi:hypothetical protein HY29_14530 [Hyphomonas beringensis]|uniref:DUF3576 domain-containing protein n=1 Tax=Hyphomonas beringensis TaxID=1280946 RepID=A0A062U9E5_9PROT|nr:DUF3576 domain-containing protein [Hyphomonas beringensis]KCZ54363.1 hypothetical protein HY29_14530 [Hyphomonas beringensis]
MIKFVFSAAVAGMLLVSGCQSRSAVNTEQKVAQQNIGSVNPYLWRAALDTFDDLPVKSADPIGGLVVYDWKTFENAPDERIKATVYILDTRLRADGVKVSVFRQTNENGEWVDAPVDPVTGVQLENKILERARVLKNSQLG